MAVLSESNRIKERLRACTTVAEVKAVAAEERKLVVSWKDQPGDRGVMFLHIVNLKKELIRGFAMQTRGRAA